MVVQFEPSIAGAVIAAGAVAAGAPVFGEGLRALRLSRAFARLDVRELRDLPSGFASVQGRVALESPLFAPLSGAACAGFELRVLHETRGTVAVLDERRAFRIVADGVAARVAAGRRPWRVRETARRPIAPEAPLTQHLESLLARAPEAVRLRRSGARLTLVEYALRPGALCHVVGQVRQSHPIELPAESEAAWLRTGTDDAPVVESRGAAGPVESPREGVALAPTATPDLWIDEGGALDFLLVSDAPLDRPALAWTPLRMFGLALGPLLTLGGLLYLAYAADRLRELGRS